MATAFDVLAEPNRRLILDLLRQGPKGVNDLVEVLAVQQPSVSKHLKVLREAGLVDVTADAQRRIYRLRTEPLRELDDWLAPYREMWSERLDVLEAHLEDMSAPKPRPARRSR
jgi:DNA-binding transcriptional ArsR family regulator